MPLTAISRRLSKLRPSLPPLGRVRQQVIPTTREHLLMQFESLGENCELGFVQEHLGVNPIGLFRWSGIDLEPLITALDADLAGIGAVENSAIYSDDTFGEYYFRDTRYGMQTHTKMFEHSLAADKAMDMLCKRTRRLCEKLLEDISEGEKIFVFQSHNRLSPTDLSRLHKAIRRLGPAAELLYLHPAEPGQRAGSVTRMEPGLIVGQIDRAGFDGVHWTISYEMWLELLAETARLCGRKVPKGITGGLEALNLPKTF